MEMEEKIRGCSQSTQADSSPVTHVTEEYIEAMQVDTGLNDREPQLTAGSGTVACCASNH